MKTYVLVGQGLFLFGIIVLIVIPGEIEAGIAAAGIGMGVVATVDAMMVTGRDIEESEAETQNRLDALVAEQRRLNALLAEHLRVASLLGDIPPDTRSASGHLVIRAMLAGTVGGLIGGTALSLVLTH